VHKKGAFMKHKKIEKEETHLMYQVSPKGNPEIKHYLFASVNSISESRQRLLTEQIAQTPQFQQSQMLVTALQDPVTSLKNKIGNGKTTIDEIKQKINQYLEDSNIKQELKELYEEIKKEIMDITDEVLEEDKQESYSRWYMNDEFAESGSDNEEDSEQESDNKDTEKNDEPLTPETNNNKDIALGLQFHARNIKKPIYPLDTFSHDVKEIMFASINSFFRPSHLLKLGFLTATAPISVPLTLPPYSAYKLIQHHRRPNRIYNAYKQEEIDKLLKINKPNKTKRKHLVKELNQKWLTEGFDGDDTDNKTIGGLLKLFTTSETAFVAVPALNVFDEKDGLLVNLKSNGFEVTAVDWMHQKSEENTTQETVSQLCAVG
jgi:membrane-associated HD superfamily phosphohydrolase